MVTASVLGKRDPVHSGLDGGGRRSMNGERVHHYLWAVRLVVPV
jgi:hypothetical protein